MYLLINFPELWDIFVLQKRKLRRTQPSTLARIVRAAGDQSQAPGLQMLCPANASLGWTRLFPNNSSDHFSTPSLQEVSAIDLISYFTWKNNHQMQTYSTSPIRQTLLFLKDSLHTQRGCPASPLYLSPFAPHKCSIGPRTLPFNLKQAHIAFILYGKHMENIKHLALLISLLQLLPKLGPFLHSHTSKTCLSSLSSSSPPTHSSPHSAMALAKVTNDFNTARSSGHFKILFLTL